MPEALATAHADASFNSHLAVECEGVGKVFRIGEELSLQHTLSTIVRRGYKAETFWALTDVSFQVEAGDFFGIVGANGSGKSTLSSLISGIGMPNTGRVTVRGRVLPLLEVGTGFNADLTGRENVTLLGTIMGLSPGEIDDQMERIADFSGVGRYFDSPIKRYSSGMQARLGFATAICFPADVYIFDEVLAVVDDSFRAECVEELSRLHGEGATVIFMSHDLKLVRSLCTNGVWLVKGSVKTAGPMEEVAAAYSASTAYTGHD
jgi:lipopolysaccharide transport system ATP-binding protein